jgi:hypothetical protein
MSCRLNADYTTCILCTLHAFINKLKLGFLCCLCVCMFCLRMSLCLICACCQLNPEEGVRSTEARVSGSCVLLCDCWGPNPGPLYEQQVLLTTEPSSSPKQCYRTLPKIPLLIWRPRCIMNYSVFTLCLKVSIVMISTAHKQCAEERVYFIVELRVYHEEDQCRK